MHGGYNGLFSLDATSLEDDISFSQLAKQWPSRMSFWPYLAYKHILSFNHLLEFPTNYFPIQLI